MSFQDTLIKLENFWKQKGCIIGLPYTSEVGAGTFNPHTFFGALGKRHYRVAYIETSKRPKDGRYAKNPNRFQEFHQYQVLLKPPPSEIQNIYINSLRNLGIEIKKHDVRFVQDDWESPTLGAWGLGWEVWLDGMEITQFTYFQQVGGIDLNPISVELTYGLERITMLIDGVDSIFELEWGNGIYWKDIYLDPEYQWCVYNFEEADIDFLFNIFNKYEKEVKRLLERALIFPAYDFVIKSSHIFNVLDARGAISVKERGNYILRIRKMAKKVAEAWRKMHS
ncbi:glycine--tRNA ligase subunit alpha [candidate division WOR-3 bacterium]|nr:glycine--tRNA ligase subunit alpha [candidate division WOR-3 bacterium]